MTKIRTSIIAVALLGSALSAAPMGERYEKGYSYYSVATQSMNFQTSYTTSTGNTIETEATVSNPIYTLGSLYVINNGFDFMTEVSTTLIPQRANETTKTNGTTTQTNNADMMNNNIQALGVYKFTNEHRALFGATYNLASWKRYNIYVNGVAQATTTVVEQRSMSLAAQVGYAYEGYYMNNQIHVSFKGLAGLPIWSQTENTAANETFDGRGGYNLDLFVTAGYNLYNNTEAGVVVGYSQIKRDEAKKGSIAVPEDKIINTYLGVYVAF